MESVVNEVLGSVPIFHFIFHWAKVLKRNSDKPPAATCGRQGIWVLQMYYSFSFQLVSLSGIG